MKHVALLLISLLSLSAHGQKHYVIDKTVVKQYNNLQLKQRSKEDARKIKLVNGNTAIWTRNKTDTLNRADIVPRSPEEIQMIEVYDSAGNLSETRWVRIVEEAPVSEDNPLFLECRCKFIKDTLTVRIEERGWGSVQLDLKIFPNGQSAWFTEKSVNEQFMSRPGSTPVKNITVPAIFNTLGFDRTPAKDVQEIYARVGITTSPYYEVTERRVSRTEYLHKKTTVDLVLKCSLEK